MGNDTANQPSGQNGAEPVYGPAAHQPVGRTDEEPLHSRRFTDGPAPPYTSPYPPYPSDLPDAPGLPLNVACGLAYFVLPAIFFLLMPPYRSQPLIRFHSWQAIFYFLAAAAVRVLDLLIGSLLPSPVAFTISSLLMLILFAGWLVATIRAFQGGRVYLPAIGSLADETARTISGR